MKKRVIALLLLAYMAASAVLPVGAREQEPFKMYTTAYHYGEITASGVPVRTGGCAVKCEWLVTMRLDDYMKMYGEKQ